PADANRSVAEFMDLRAALADPDMVDEAASRFAMANASDGMQAPLLSRAARGALEGFYRGGFDGIIGAVPEADRPRVLEFAIPMIQATLSELRDVMREQTGREALAEFGNQTREQQEWLQLALLAFANL